jgi:hypothetical protein
MRCVAFAPALARCYDQWRAPFRVSVPLCYTIPHRGVDGLPCDDMGCHLILLHFVDWIYLMGKLQLLHNPPPHMHAPVACFEVDSRKEGESYESRVESEVFISFVMDSQAITLVSARWDAQQGTVRVQMGALALEGWRHIGCETRQAASEIRLSV